MRIRIIRYMKGTRIAKKLPTENQKGSDPPTRSFFLKTNLPRRKQRLQKIRKNIYLPNIKQPVIFMSANTLTMLQKRRKISSASIARRWTQRSVGCVAKRNTYARWSSRRHKLIMSGYGCVWNAMTLLQTTYH